MVDPASDRISRAPPYSGSSPAQILPLRLRDFHPLRSPFPVAFRCGSIFSPTARQTLHSVRSGPSTPMMQRCKPLTHHGFRLFPFRSPLLWESRLISFPPGTEMVQFPESPPLQAIVSPQSDRLFGGRVTPFGNPRITGCLLLPAAFRSLPRPSSSSSSKASTIDPSSLDHIPLSPFSPFPSPYVKDLAVCSLRAHLQLGGAQAALGLTRLELVTSRLSGARSNHLSYRPGKKLQGKEGKRLR